MSTRNFTCTISALWQALREIFSAAQMKGCVFHWTQVVLRRINVVGLKTTYEKREAVHALMRKLMAVPFLSGIHIPRAFSGLAERATSMETEAVEVNLAGEDSLGTGRVVRVPADCQDEQRHRRVAPSVEFEGSRPQVLLLCFGTSPTARGRVPAIAGPAGARGNRAGPTQHLC
ncbi:uncharacterized protein LOC127834866 [Dreissena polymorpha]|uniref:uncharacterized protein LOC127834866 n=1 Tax=Dreissena polymorpha TaxID=45954 RepID=UPI002263DC6B|nr:uncharacterized protein LOC127834866 [Dreissena polymorpha]